MVEKEELMEFMRSIVDKAIAVVQAYPSHSPEAIYYWGKKDACVEIRNWIERKEKGGENEK